jgi:hypothetical protein
MLSDQAKPFGVQSMNLLLTNPVSHAILTPVSSYRNPGWRLNPAATLLYEDYLRFIARYNIE